MLNKEDGELFLAVLMDELSFDFLMDAQEAFKTAAEAGHTLFTGMRAQQTHRSTALGQMRYFANATAVTDLFNEHGRVEKIPGADRIVTGYINNTQWTFTAVSRKRREPRASVQRRRLAQSNKPLQALRQADLFETLRLEGRLTVWFEVRYKDDGPYPSEVRVVVPHADGRRKLFEIGLEDLLSKYEDGRVPQQDKAFPRLKEAVLRQQRQSE